MDVLNHGAISSFLLPEDGYKINFEYIGKYKNVIWIYGGILIPFVNGDIIGKKYERISERKETLRYEEIELIFVDNSNGTFLKCLRQG